MDEEAFLAKTRSVALASLKLCDSLPKTRSGDVIGRQLLRSGTSVGANYRAACRAKSLPDMLAKLGIVEEESDETIYWLELLLDAGLVEPDRIRELVQQTREILAMTIASKRTIRSRIDGINRKSEIGN